MTAMVQLQKEKSLVMRLKGLDTKMDCLKTTSCKVTLTLTAVREWFVSH
jgi:hypothetical protein